VEEQYLSLCSKLYPFVITAEELEIQLILKFPNGDADSGLGNVQAFRGLNKTQVISNSQKDFKLTEIHIQ
jgi:hypothetical protein